MYFKNAQRGTNEWFLYVALLVAVFIATQLGTLLSYSYIELAIKNDPTLGTKEVDNFFANPDFTLFGIDSNFGFFLLLVPFVCGFIMFYFAFPILHKRAFVSLISWNNKLDWNRVFFGFILWFILGSLMHVVNYFQNPNIFSFQFELQKFLPLLILSLLILPLQTSLEEFVFRSYLLQGIGNIEIGVSKNIMIIGAWLITSILFGMVHMSNPEVQSYGIVPMMVYYIGAGLFLGLITIWDNRLELALGVHAATNFISAVFVGYNGAAIQTDSLFKISELNVWFAAIGFYVLAIIFTFVCRSKYSWGQLLKPALTT